MIQEAFVLSLGFFFENVIANASLADTIIAHGYSVVPTTVLSSTASQRLVRSPVLQKLVVFSRALIVTTFSYVACPACMRIAPSALER